MNGFICRREDAIWIYHVEGERGCEESNANTPASLQSLLGGEQQRSRDKISHLSLVAVGTFVWFKIQFYVGHDQ